MTFNCYNDNHFYPTSNDVDYAHNGTKCSGAKKPFFHFLEFIVHSMSNLISTP